MASTLDTGRGSRRFSLPGGMTIGEGWVNDPEQSYNFGKAGIVPEETGELEGVHGEGVAGSRAGLSSGSSAAMQGLRAALGGGGNDEAPGAGLMRRLTSSPAEAVAHGLVEDPEAVAARTQILQNQARASEKGAEPAYKQAQDAVEMQYRTQPALQALAAQLQPGNEDMADIASEAAAKRNFLPYAKGLHARTEEDKATAAGLALQPHLLAAQTDMYRADQAAAGAGARAGATAKSAALKGLADQIDALVKARANGDPSVGADDISELQQLYQGMIRRGGG